MGKSKRMDQKIMKQKIIRNNQGFGVVEVILIIVVVIALIIIFQEQITSIFNRAMGALKNSTESYFNNITPTP